MRLGWAWVSSAVARAGQGAERCGQDILAKLPLVKLHTWEVVTQENILGKLTIGKKPLGNYLTCLLIPIRYGIGRRHINNLICISCLLRPIYTVEQEDDRWVILFVFHVVIKLENQHIKGVTGYCILSSTTLHSRSLPLRETEQLMCFMVIGLFEIMTSVLRHLPFPQFYVFHCTSSLKSDLTR